jgi:hypothetical protein
MVRIHFDPPPVWQNCGSGVSVKGYGTNERGNKPRLGWPVAVANAAVEKAIARQVVVASEMEGAQ